MFRILNQKIATFKNILSTIKTGQSYLVDVRTTQEYNNGHIPNAIHLPIQKIEEMPQLLQKYKDKPLVFYCKAGIRSKRATDIANHLNLKSSNYKGSWDEYHNFINNK